jgi:methionyl-tRNA formyltransferase
MLAASEHHIAGVLAHQPVESSSATLWQAAHRMGYAARPAELVKSADFADEVERLQVDLLLNVHSLYLIDAALLSVCRIGAFNLHPGPLPSYAGLNVPSWAIYHGETEHAVTLHEMVPQIDAGKIAYEQRFAIDRRDTGLTLTRKAIRAGVLLIAKLIAAASVSPETIPRIDQDLSARRYFGAGPPNGGKLSWNRSAIDVVNHIRASDFAPFDSPWGHPKTFVNGTEIGIAAADLTNQPTGSQPGTVGETLDGGILVAAADEWVLVRQVNVDGRRTSPLESFCPGDRLCEAS